MLLGLERPCIVFVDLANNIVYNFDGSMLTGSIADEVLQHIDKSRRGAVGHNFSLEDRVATLHQRKDLQKTRTNERKEDARKHQSWTCSSNREASQETVQKTTDEAERRPVGEKPELG